MGVMSMSKTVSAAAVVALLPWKFITIDSPISPYFPASWKRGPNVDKLTFRMLMTHTTGLKGVAEGPDNDSAAFANLEKMVANGVIGSVPAMVSYLNEGYDLLRIILPYLWNGPREELG
jgi:CubicO group peptidase (beta-lactamase class C family)